MKNYSEYQLEDFVQDPYFQKWILGISPQTDSFWRDWIVQNPSRQPVIDQARELVLGMQIQQLEGWEQDFDERKETIFNLTTRKQTISIFSFSWLRIAAMLTLTAGLLWWFSVDKQRSRPVSQNLTSSKTIKKEELKVIHLSDGSIISLSAGSKISIDKHFNQDNRKVYLSGQAFFEIKPNPQKPFFVVTAGLVTKVLGTSFLIKAYKGDSRISVSVRTGKVTVFKKPAGILGTMPSEYTELLPNQAAVFVKSEQKIVKTLVEAPVLINIPKNGASAFVYDESSIPSVFTALEEAYGVKIVYDASLLASCNLTADMGDEPLYDKLDLICETIQASYKISDGQVVVTAKGCK
ncbi:MAG: FecR family protein [Dyadobacter sp.]